MTGKIDPKRLGMSAKELEESNLREFVEHRTAELAAENAAYTIDIDVLYPRDARHRYRIYAVVPGEHPRVLATTATVGGVGAALVQLHKDAKDAGGRLADEGRVGVLDVMAEGAHGERAHGEWVVLPWDRQGGR